MRRTLILFERLKPRRVDPNYIARDRPGSTPWSHAARQKKAVAKFDVTIKESSTPYIYVSSNTDSDLVLSTTKQDAEALFSRNTEYVSPANFGYALPNEGVPEFAFIGRSNVGKSSLISKLVGPETTVRVSKQPGCTKSVNYFGYVRPSSADTKLGVNDKISMNRHELYLIDLPGYGFAKVGQEERYRWRAVIDGYLLTRDQNVLRRVFLLIDARHGVKDVDVDMMLRLDASGCPYQVSIC